LLALKMEVHVKEDKIVETIAKFYLESGDFNGYPVYLLKKEFRLSDTESKDLIRDLVRSRRIDAVFGNIHPNPHIKAFSNISTEDQLRFLDEIEFSEHFCLYPNSVILSALPEAKQFDHAPYEKELVLGAGQLDFRVFDLSVLEYYRNDPRYYYETDFINGHISIRDEHFKSDSMPEHDQVLLETFGFAYDDDLNRAVAVFLRYLSKLSPEHQKIWAAKALKGNYKLHPDYYRNSILGDWGTSISIFDAFTQELALINEMAALIGKASLFKESYTKERPKEFGFLLRPTLAEFNGFVLLLDKMMSDNINKEFFADDLSLEEEEEREDGKTVVRQKGTITLLEEWIRRYFRPADPRPLDQMYTAFRKVRKLRQKPAHAVNENVFDLKYFQDQRQLVIEAYDAVRTLRLILANHRSVKRNPPTIGEHLYKGEIWDI
jgi:hypothetical protein